MLVYLDTSQLDHLERAARAKGRQRAEPQALKEFFRVWEARGCVLAITRAHIDEMAPTRDGTDAMVESRVEVLRRFPAMVSAGPEVIQRELVARLASLAQGTSAAEMVVAFRRGMWSPIDADAIARIRRDQDGVVRATRAFDDAEAVRAERARAFNSARFGPQPKVTRGDVARLAAREHIWWLRCLARAYPDDFSTLWYLTRLVRNAGVPLPSDPPPHHELTRWIPDLDPYVLPATSLFVALLRVRHRDRTRRPTTNDTNDCEHLTYAPYVDLAFADGPTVALIERETAQRGRYLAPDLRLRLRRAASVPDMTAAIEAVDGPPGCDH